MNNSAQFFARFKAALNQLPGQFGAEIVRYSYQRFTEQGWDGQPWQRRRPGTKNDNGRALLIKTGRMRRAIRVTRKSTEEVAVGVPGIPYARAHNEGFNGTVNVKAHNRRIRFEAAYSNLDTPRKVRKTKGIYESKVESFTRRMRMPRRRFLGDSPYLRRNLERIAIAAFNNAFKGIK